jgi:hypothetical protein
VEKIVGTIMRQRSSFCCTAWYIAIGIIVLTYVTLCIKFERKVRIFYDGLKMGAYESNAIEMLGSPSFLWINKSGARLGPSIPDADRYDIFVYSGLPFFRNDLILYFSSEEKILRYKRRSMHAPGWDPAI